jgi:cell division protein FtsB
MLGLVGIAVYLYYQPLASYLETRRELSEARTEVEVLRAAKANLEQRLVVSTSVDATRREARRMGYIRPGEQLFIVKGVPAWRQAHARSVRGDG